jgi:hypothetical protein
MMRELNTQEMTLVAGGLLIGGGTTTDEPCGCDGSSTTRAKGNNGWGNGREGTNRGSSSGGTAGSKSDEAWSLGDGPGPRKFGSR